MGLLLIYSGNLFPFFFCSPSCLKPKCSCINMTRLEVARLWTTRPDEMCVFGSHKTCQTSLTDPAHFQPSMQCFENVSAVLLNYADNIRTPHVFLTGSGLNYLSAFTE